jgi:hypothetical protein
MPKAQRVYPTSRMTRSVREIKRPQRVKMAYTVNRRGTQTRSWRTILALRETGLVDINKKSF